MAGRDEREHQILDALERARDANDAGPTLLALLDAWALRPYPALVELIELAGVRAATERGPIELGERRADQQTRWIAQAQQRDPVTMPWLIEHLVTSQSGASKLRIVELENWPLDPRMSIGLLEVARTKPLTSRQNRPFWTRLFRVVQQHLHAGLQPAITELLQGVRVTEFDSLFQRHITAIDRKLARLPRIAAPSPEIAPVLEAIGGRLGLASQRAAEKTLDDFMREIWAAPLDDGPREVFADWLLERDDPWGELITLQLARWRAGPAATKSRRERALLDDHARDWLGPLEPVVLATNARFERGFLYSCKVHWRRLAALPALMTHPAWATVREYEIDGDGERACDAWLDHMIALGAKRR